ncbi:374_t:CDS:10 [Acaulospora colombiana]|uniref:374_t:CDS:1 n=1 Tax=Acaulospora colombiana TaxID=27376 RepID=A0ACA9L817_9GLOM|nr:374_t:CDS:10 [Acaulospora colombiana]
MGITTIKDGFEDFKRHVTDRSVNNRKTWTLGNWCNVNYPEKNSGFLKWKESTTKKSKVDKKEWKKTMFKDVRVGDFIKLYNDDFIPAGEEKNYLCSTLHGLYAIEDIHRDPTKNLDGETNLKIRNGISEIDYVTTPEDCASVRFYVDSEPPTTSLFSYNATVVFPHGLPGRSRGRGGPKKIPVNLNSMLLRGCVLKNTEWVIGLVLFTGADTKLSLNSGKTPSKRSRIEKLMNPQVLVNLAILVILCLWCSIGSRIWAANLGGSISYLQNDNINLDSFLAFFIFMDEEIHYTETDTPCIPKNWNLSDDLGQVEYIFSDKTGTLTRNVMEFRKCSIGGKIYGEYSGINNNEASFNLVPPESRNINDESKSSSIPTKKPFSDSQLSLDMRSTDSNRSKFIRDFFTLLAICHTVLVNTNDNGEQVYRAQSPDEAALVQAAKDVGYTFRSRESDNIIITTPEGEEVHYELMNILEFTSARKRMSIIVRSPLDGRIILFCKGADNVIFDRLKSGQDFVSNVTSENLQEFAREGLRTLCLGYTEVTPEEYQKWNIEFREASTSLVDRDQRIATVSDQIEKNLTLLGATAIEDRLQDGVPECIATLKRAGIKIWVLTGDKMETAISIGFSTCLLSRDMNLIIIRGGAYGETGSAYDQMRSAVEKFFPTDEAILESMKSVQAPPVSSFSNTPRPSTSHHGDHALIIDGVALKYALEEPWSRNLFLDLACRCKGVICCRVSPLQKAKVVELVKKGKEVLTCAIGDGANDVSMIQAAHVGIGVAGEEGLQAVMASDYAIAQFRYLTRLLLVHGHYAYIRNSSMILNFFYKNMIGVGLFDRDVPDRVAIEVPELYQMGIKQKAYTMPIFFVFMMEGLYQSLICFFVPYLAYGTVSSNKYGREPDYLEEGTTMAVACIAMANFFTGFNSQCWTVFHYISVFGSTALIFIYVAIYSLIPFADVYGYYEVVYTSGRNYFPTDVDIIQEICKKDPNHDFTNDIKVNPSLGLTRQQTRDSKYEGGSTESLKSTDTPRPSFTTDRTVLQPQQIVTSPQSRTSMDYQPSGSGEIPETPGSMTYMQTGLTELVRGYAFSQEEGTGRIMAPPLRRRKTNPGPLNSTSRREIELDTLRRRSLPEGSTSGDFLEMSEIERTRMVQFRESIGGGTITSSVSPSTRTSAHLFEHSDTGDIESNEHSLQQISEADNDDS